MYQQISKSKFLIEFFNAHYFECRQTNTSNYLECYRVFCRQGRNIHVYIYVYLHVCMNKSGCTYQWVVRQVGWYTHIGGKEADRCIRVALEVDRCICVALEVDRCICVALEVDRCICVCAYLIESRHTRWSVLWRVAVSCSVFKCVAECCSVFAYIW